MRSITEELATRLASGVTTLAHVWRVTRRDGAVFGFTDHDRELVFDGVTCAPSQALSVGAIEKSVGLGVDTASLSGALNADTIMEDDLKRGLWDSARIELYRVDWTDPSLRVHLFAGRIAGVRRGALGFEAELRGLQAPLNVPVGRVFSRFCDADLGDARCGIDLEDAAFRGEGVVSEVSGERSFRATGLEAFTGGWFTRGRIVWDEGGESEVAAYRAGDGATIEILDVTSALVLGASFTIFAGCDKRHETCRAKFANVANFRGFSHMPGNDALIAQPVQGQTNDGGSRFG